MAASRTKHQEVLRSLSNFLVIVCRFRVISRRSCCRNKLLLTFTSAVFVIVVISSLSFYNHNFTCSMDEEIALFKDICVLHGRSAAFGNLCGSLCIEKEIKPHSCIVHHSGKELVNIALWNEKKIVIKSSYKHVKKFDQIFFSDNADVPGHVYPEMDLFLDMVIQSVSFYLNQSIVFTQKTDVIDLIWTMNYTYLKSLPHTLQNVAMSNIWYLLQQPEYVLSKLYVLENIFPKVLGTCGHIYAVEYLQPIDSYFGVLHPSWRYPFIKRVDWALDLLRLFESFDNKFHSILHICDVKVGHFGFASDGTLRLLDLDMAYFEETLQANMVAPSSCRNNYDCAFIDCHGFCKLNHCQRNITNNNFQRLCTNIFYGYSGQDLFGLLSSPPVGGKTDLTSLLLMCMKNPSSAQTAVKLIKKYLREAALAE